MNNAALIEGRRARFASREERRREWGRQKVPDSGRTPRKRISPAFRADRRRAEGLHCPVAVIRGIILASHT